MEQRRSLLEPVFITGDAGLTRAFAANRGKFLQGSFVYGKKIQAKTVFNGCECRFYDLAALELLCSHSSFTLAGSLQMPPGKKIMEITRTAP